ncbi:hypothetical protein [Thalassotalea atypica]|uniref:hypothetical protein n=1 Tax=Thalassotalea atypica TaxID=2054316 RepID=UPI0025735470|nr:hypothetical protein [Thalassotalea atypica]
MLASNGRLITIVWIIFLTIFYLTSGYIATTRIYDDKVESEQRQKQRIDPKMTENGKTQVNAQALLQQANDDYDEVIVGIYADRIIDLSAKLTGWSVDFYIWFNWDNEALNPGETFQIVDGEIKSKVRLKNMSHDGQYYALYRVKARITKFFNVVSYPLDHHMLSIHIEDKKHPWHMLRYVPDQRATTYSSRIKVPGYKLTNVDIISKPHAYKTNRGNPALPDNYQAVYSQITYGINIERPDWGLYFKMFQGLFASVAIALLAFILGSSAKERFSLGVGAFFASVGSSYMNMNHLPGVGIVTLIDMANGLTMGTIFLTLLGSALSSGIASNENQQSIAKLFNRVSLIFFIGGFVSVHLLMALIAAS